LTPPTGLVLFSHGSLLCGSSGILNQHARQLRNAARYVAVEPGYLNYCDPPVEKAIAACVAAGAERVLVIPYFLIAGKFVREDLPPRLDSAMQQFPGVEFRIARALEDISLLYTAVERLLPTATSPALWQQQAIARARALCELRKDCPLYGTAPCKTGELSP
jgi:sirohydrochlorin cobaltochelatase